MTELLLSDRMAPITSEIGFIERDAEGVGEWFRGWDESNVRARAVAVVSAPISGTLAAMLGRLQPLTSVERRRYLFVPTKSPPWCAFFDNGWTGTDAGSLCSYAAVTLQCRAIRAVAIPNTKRTAARSEAGRYGATIFELYGPGTGGATLNTERAVGSVNDGGKWHFDEVGPLLPFEDPKTFAARSIRDRFTPEHLARYLEQFGIRAFDEDFYQGGGVLVERRGPFAADVRQYTLEEARAKLEAPA